MAPLAVIWFILALPFRLVFLFVALLGRIVGVSLGFAFMVVGIALTASPAFFVGIPLFVVGVIVMLRSVE